MKKATTPPSKPRFWDNLIPLRADSTGHQLAGWQPAAKAMQGLGCQILADQRVPVEGGMQLAADVYLPKPAGRYPAILVFGAYTKELHSAGIPAGTNEVGCPPVFTERGYAHVIVTRRGMGQSDGAFDVFFNEQEIRDHEAAIAWAAAQPWCNGEVVMFGTSYYGCVQANVAVRRPAALKAFFTHEMCTDYFRHIVMYGGTPNTEFLSLWLGSNFTDAVMRLRIAPLVRAAISQVLNSGLKKIWQPRLRKQIRKIMVTFTKKTPALAARQVFANWLIDGKTRATNRMPAGPSEQLGNIDVPFVVVQNEAMWNLHQFGSFDLWQHASTPRNKQWLIIGQATYSLPAYEWQQEALAFFDHILRGTPNGYAEQPRVRYWVEGAGRFEGAEDFPLPAATRKRFYLTASADDRDLHELAENAPSEGTNSWAAVPLGATTTGGFDEVVNQTLVYRWTAPQDMAFAGPVTAALSFSCNEIDSHVVARLSHVSATGVETLLSMGMMRPARRRIDERRSTACEIALDTDVAEPLVPGEAVALKFSLTPAPVRVRRGEQLRLAIASRTDLLRSDQSHDHAHFDCQVPPYFSRNTIHCGADSYVELDAV
ncbi:CocE/NonD family hydrolase [Dyella acidiphila]|uniref:CocE/NonD family hydrolase n=1 Tax=Dyella acidiphila TaxID=2775866 RepID=A0ABR9G743_9GAMM|nr:CocE/NonD family hydrolase [Dyella acidiphila]MBE1159872.1 CocE/NonD family hydrolase [Dyella acidiphila]